MNSNEFKETSFLGRMAFCINCFEETLILLEYDLDEWIPVLEDLWKITSIEFLDDWYDLMAEILPKNLLEFESYDSDYECINEEKFNYLYSLYLNIDEKLEIIMEHIFCIGTCHAYSIIENDGLESLEQMQKLINYMTSSNIPMPNIDKYKKYSINENRGWGRKFDGKTVSIIL